jgi:hypothetical protein
MFRFTLALPMCFVLLFGVTACTTSNKTTRSIANWKKIEKYQSGDTIIIKGEKYVVIDAF